MSRRTNVSRRHVLAGAAGTLALATAGRVAAQAGRPNIVRKVWTSEGLTSLRATIAIVF